MGKRSRSKGADSNGHRHARPVVHWVGEQLRPASLAYVNRELCRRLVAADEVDLELLTREAARTDDPALADIARRMRPMPSHAADVVVRHQWPPDFHAPRTGAWVMIQPWEFGGLPRAWVEPMRDRVDEIWCCSTFVRDCYEMSGVPAPKLHLLPHGIDTSLFSPEGPHYPLATDRRFKFLFLGGTIFRKGIDVALSAYLRAFSARDDVCLVVKGSLSSAEYKGSSIAALIADLQRESPDRAPIEYIDADLPHDQVASLYRACDALVAPYRGEGFGMPISEAMAARLPVIVTGDGAALDFCDDTTAFLIPSERRPVESGGLPPSSVGYWLAEPDVDALASILRNVYEHPDEARVRAAAARERVVAQLRWDVTAARALDRLHHLAGVRPVRESPSRAQPSRAQAPLWAPASGPAPSGAVATVASSRTGGPQRRATGLNVVGLFSGEFGIGEAGRLLVEAVGKVGLPYGTINVRGTACREEHPFEEHGNARIEHDTNLLCLQPLILAEVMKRLGPAARGGRHSIGYWFWETEQLPANLHVGFKYVDEVWAGSTFTRDAIAAVAPCPVAAVPPPVRIPDPPTLGRGDLGLDDRFTFLFMFDYFSAFERKNPLAVIDAFRLAFPPDSGPMLVLKGLNPDRFPELREALHRRCDGRRDIVLIERYLTHEENNALIGLCDSYVSLHRSEGFGLTLAEAMAHGKPVIATAYSGNLDFTTDSNSFLVPYTMVQVPPDSPNYESTARWADADVDAAARAMRAIYDHPGEAAEIGRRARHDMRTQHSVEARARLIASLLGVELDQDGRIVTAGAMSRSGSRSATVAATEEPFPLDGRRGTAVLYIPEPEADDRRRTLSGYFRTFTDRDDVTLVIWVPADPRRSLESWAEEITAAAADAGVSDDAPDVLVVHEPPSDTLAERLRASVDAVLVTDEEVCLDVQTPSATLRFVNVDGLRPYYDGRREHAVSGS